jgi:pyruvate dehydrogenase E2 component (dihydrolipoamide acetyltransferase)
MAWARGLELSAIRGTGPGGSILRRDVEAHADTSPGRPQQGPARGALRPTSLAMRLAQRGGIPLEEVAGSGPGGRVFLRDLESAVEGRTRSVRPSAPASGVGLGQTFPMSRMRRVIAKRMSESALTAPHIYFFTDVDMGRLLRLRGEVVQELERDLGVRLSINDFILKAAALTIREFPLLNGRVEGETVVVHPEINVGLAVAAEEGLLVPAIPRTDQLGLAEIALLRADLVERARAGRLTLEEMERGTFTVSSLAQFDVTCFTAILNPPQSGILSVGKLDQRLALVDGQVQAKPVTFFGLSVDHRIIDGTLAAAFLQAFKRKLENPAYAFLQL